MPTKKKSSFIFAPFHVLQLFVSVIKLVRSAVVRATVEIQNIDEGTEQDEVDGFKKMQKAFADPVVQKAWNRFIITGLSIQFLFLVICLVQVFSFDPIILIQSLLLLIGSIVFFGYKPFILETKTAVPFWKYLQKIKKHSHCIMLWRYYNRLKEYA